MADANAFFSAFIRNGLTRRLWMKLELDLFAPAFIAEELAKHSPELFEKSGLQPEENKKLLNKLFSRLSIVKNEEFLPYAQASSRLVIDPKDEKYVACALAVGADLWSRDRHLKQPRVKCWGTQQLAQYFGYVK